MDTKLDSKKTITELKRISSTFGKKCGALRFGSKIHTVYNPLVYAVSPHNRYLELAGAAGAPKKVIFLGMNPGLWGMAQTGVPFGEVAAVRGWLGIDAPVAKPEKEHPRHPIDGFDCRRSEVSGRRLWGLFAARFGTPRRFFADHFVTNYCPLAFIDSGGANITPDQLSAGETTTLFDLCNAALVATIELFKPKWVIGIGAFAKKRIDTIGGRFFTAQILHPSPANPKANVDWEGEVTKALEALGVWSR